MKTNARVISLIVPYPPSVNHYWRAWRGRVCVSAEGRRYAAALTIAAAKAGLRGLRLEGALAVRCEFYPPDRRRRDLDNVAKALYDALTRAGIWGDDSQVADAHFIRREADKARPRVELTISIISGGENG